jgi:hypothetical protein
MTELTHTKAKTSNYKSKIKIVVSIFMLAFEYKYALDADGYFTNAVAQDFTFEGFVFGNGTIIIQQLIWFHLKIIPDSYHAAKVGFALISLI